MKKRFLPLLLCLALLLSACGPAASGAAEPAPEPVQEPTDSLTVYISDALIGRYLTLLRREFEQSHPGVTLEITTVDTNEELADTTTLATELAAGRGPDLYIGWGKEFKDFYKVLNTGTFCDITPYLENRESLDRANYVENILDAGMYRGKLCFVPLTWRYPGVLTTQETLDRAGIDAASLGTYSGLMQAARTFSDTHGGNSAFCLINGSEIFFNFAGDFYLNYETLTLSLDAPEFREMIDAYKLIYAQDQGVVEMGLLEYYNPARYAYSLQNDLHIFSNGAWSLNEQDIGVHFGYFTKRETSLLLPFPTVDGKTDAEVVLFAAINANSKNKANAADMIELLLQEDMQVNLAHQQLAVHTGALYRQIKEMQTWYMSKGSIDSYADNGTLLATRKIFSPDELDYIVEKLSYVDTAHVYKGQVLYTIFTDMEPYFKDEQTYETCLQKLQSDLTIYISE